MRIRLDRRKVTVLLVAAICLLATAHVVTQLLAFKLGDENLHGLAPIFDLDKEANLPTYYSALTLLFAAAILASIAHYEKSDSSRYPYWLGLAVVFVILSVDETILLHETAGELIRGRYGLSGYLYFSWIIPFGFFLVVLFVLYFRFFVRLPARIRWLIIAAGTICAVGLLGLEAIAGHHYELYGEETLTFVSLATAEEILEMTGVAIFIYALLLYIELECEDLAVRFAFPHSQPTSR